MVGQICSSCGRPGIGVQCEECSGPLVPEPRDPALGKYSITREIGRGSMGVVYDAQDTTLNRRVALKVMHSGRAVDPKEAMSDWQRFMQEARVTANLARHPNIVTLYEAAVYETRRYIAMEYIPGEPLTRWRVGRSVREQIRLLRDVVRAVHHAHENGIIHRDLKPANVLVGKGGVPVVTDFGLATPERRMAGMSLTPTGTIVGSPTYMSPEQARGGKEVSRTTDIYSLGVMLYETLAGRPPFEGKNPVEVLSKSVEGTKVAPSTIAPAGTGEPALDAICLRAMALDPKDRYSSADKLAQDLTHWLDGTSMSRRTRPRLTLMIAAASAALAVFAVMYALQIRAERRAEQREREMIAKLAPPPKPIAAAPIVAALETFKPDKPTEWDTSTPQRIVFASPVCFEAPVDFPETAAYEVQITASCSSARGELARMRLLLDARTLADLLLTSEKPSDYRVDVTIPAGSHRIGLQFMNDLFDQDTREDRNLFIHHLSFRRK